MTMRNPLIDAERNLPIAKTFDPAKNYRFTWPGRARETVDGAKLTEICAGANVDLLDIEEAGNVSEAPVSPLVPASSFSTRPEYDRR